ncbi:hypothetical protein EJB05_02551, partial [Eragrostis curvula]
MFVSSYKFRLSTPLYAHPSPFLSEQCDDLLHRRSTTGTGPLVASVSTASATYGFLKFLGPYYMLLIIAGRRKVGTICGHDLYSVDKSRPILILAPAVLPDVAHSCDEKRYKRYLRSVNICKDFFFSYSYNIMHALRKNISYDVPHPIAGEDLWLNDGPQPVASEDLQLDDGPQPVVGEDLRLDDVPQPVAGEDQELIRHGPLDLW